GDQLFPSHLAMEQAVLPPAFVNFPPAYTLLPDTASASTSSFMPAPNDDQLVPSHLATLLAALPPALVKKPPAKRSPPATANARTTPPPALIPTPDPSPDQLIPSH